MLRFTYPIAFWLAVAVQCFAQEAQPRMSFLSAPVCGAAEADDQGPGALSLREEVQRLLADLPRGRERDLALQLLKEVSEGRLQGSAGIRKAGNSWNFPAEERKKDPVSSGLPWGTAACRGSGPMSPPCPKAAASATRTACRTERTRGRRSPLGG